MHARIVVGVAFVVMGGRCLNARIVVGVAFVIMGGLSVHACNRKRLQRHPP